MAKSDIFEKQDHPYDHGYWKRYDDFPRDECHTAQEKRGWDDCDAELKFAAANKAAALARKGQSHQS